MSTPLVVVGVPVYNGARTLPQTLDALCAQTLHDIELVISDNGSTDETAAICQAYAARDKRIHYIRQSTNLGLPRNWNFVATARRGKYFKWASGNDLVSPNYLEACVAVLEAEPDVVLAFGRTALIGAAGELIEEYRNDLALMQASPVARLRALTEELRLNNAISGVVRHATLLQTGLIRLYPASDVVLMAELALRGKLQLVPAAVFSRRADPTSMTTKLSKADAVRLHDPGATGPAGIVTRRHRDLAMAVLAAPGLRLGDRLSGLRLIAQRALWSRDVIAAELKDRLLYRLGRLRAPSAD